MSYRRAWLLVDTMNQSFKLPWSRPLPAARGRWCESHRDRHEVLQRYLEMEAKAAASVKDLAQFMRLMAGR
jgi:molybdate transport system regulatory protein